MSLPAAPAIARMFSLAVPYEPHLLDTSVYYLAMPKLNGVRAMWVPGAGFFSRDGVAYEPGILPNIEAACMAKNKWLDGEFYVHGWPLQKINSVAGVVRDRPHPLHYEMRFHVFDDPQDPRSADERMDALSTGITLNTPIIPVPYRQIKCCDQADAAHAANLAQDYEGTVYKHIGNYQFGRGKKLLKRKGWLDEDFEIFDFVQGVDGKYSNTLGVIICKTAAGILFRVGSFVMDDADRDVLWNQYKAGKRFTRAKVKFLGLTSDGKPYNSRVLLIT